MAEGWRPDVTVDELDLILGRVARIGGQLDFTLRMLWLQLNDVRERVDAVAAGSVATLALFAEPRPRVSLRCCGG